MRKSEICLFCYSVIPYSAFYKFPVKSIFDKVTSWPQLIPKLLVAPACLHVACDWSHTFFTSKVFLFSITYYSLLFERVMYYSYLLHKIKGNLIILHIKLHITCTFLKRVIYCRYLLLEIYVQLRTY